MTREEKLTSMTMACLAQVAARLGIKIDKKGAKAKAVAKILEAEAQQTAEKTEVVKKLNKKQNEANEFTNISDADVEAEIAKTKAEEKKEKKASAKKTETAKKTEEKEPKMSASEVNERLQSILGQLAVNFIVGRYSVVLRDENKKKYAEICCNKNGLRIYLREDAPCIEKLGDRVEDDPSPSGKYTKIVLVAMNEMFELVSKLVA